METEIRLPAANCPDCFEEVRSMLSEDPGVRAVHASFSDHCMRVELGSMSEDELVECLRHNLHGVDVAGNGDLVMVEVSPMLGEWHCKH